MRAHQLNAADASQLAAVLTRLAPTHASSSLEVLTPTDDIVCVSTVFRDEGVVAPRLSSSCTQKRITSAGMSVLWCATSAAPMSAEKSSSSHENTHTQLKQLQRIETCFSLPVSLRYLYMSLITPLSMLLRPILDGRKRQHAATMGNTGQHTQHNLTLLT